MPKYENRKHSILKLKLLQFFFSSLFSPISWPLHPYPTTWRYLTEVRNFNVCAMQWKWKRRRPRARSIFFLSLHDFVGKMVQKITDRRCFWFFFSVQSDFQFASIVIWWIRGHFCSWIFPPNHFPTSFSRKYTFLKIRIVLSMKNLSRNQHSYTFTCSKQNSMNNFSQIAVW